MMTAGRTGAERTRATVHKESTSSRRSSRKTTSTEEREGEPARRSSRSASRHKRDRIAPEGAMLRSKEKSPDLPRRRKSSKSGGHKLKVDTNLDGDDYNASTPRTEATTPNSVRSDGGPRSPGQRKSPSSAKVASATDATPIPDLITQTDRNGNAVTPRNPVSIDKARKEHPSGPKPHLRVGTDGQLHEEESVGDMEACAETLMDSIRIMCCCFMPDETPALKSVKTQQTEACPEEPLEKPRLLPALHVDDKGKKCLVLDLDETLVHSSFRAVPGADFVIPVQIEDVVHFVYVLKRPGVDEFLIEMAKHYEIVIYTASLNKYADPLLDLLDPKRVIRTRLFRESCVYYEGNYVKDLSLLDRDLSDTIIVDNSPSSYIFHPENAIDCSSYIDDPSDRELDQIAAFLKGAKDIRDVRGNCHMWREWPNVNLEGQ